MWMTLRELIVYSRLAYPTLLAVCSYLFKLVVERTARFNPDRDIPNLSGKVILITGANGGIGEETARQLVKHNPSRIYLAARNREKAQHAISNIEKCNPGVKISFVPLDLTSFDSITKAAKDVLRDSSRLDVLILNAGIMSTPYATTAQNYEAQLGTNYLGHALLVKLLLPLMDMTSRLPEADVRIVSVASIAHHMAPQGGIVFDAKAMRLLTPAQLYGQSKLANILLVKALAKRYPNITSIAIHPGIIRTELYDPVQKAMWPVRLAMATVGGLVFADVHFGALNQLWAATAARGNVCSGQYYMPIGQSFGASRYALDAELSERLWDWTEEQFERHNLIDTKKSV